MTAGRALITSDKCGWTQVERYNCAADLDIGGSTDGAWPGPGTGRLHVTVLGSCPVGRISSDLSYVLPDSANSTQGSATDETPPTDFQVPPPTSSTTSTTTSPGYQYVAPSTTSVSQGEQTYKVQQDQELLASAESTYQRDNATYQEAYSNAESETATCTKDQTQVQDDQAGTSDTSPGQGAADIETEERDCSIAQSDVGITNGEEATVQSDATRVQDDQNQLQFDENS